MAQLLIVEDERNFARLMVSMVSSVIEATIVPTLREAEPLLNRPWDGVVFDIRLPDGCGLDRAKDFRAEQPNVEVLLFTGDYSPRVVDDAARHGIVCADKAAGFAVFERFVAVCAKLAAARTRTRQRLDRLAEQASLTGRECELIGHELRGMSRVQIAAAMGITENTVRSAITEVLRKTDHERMSQLIAALSADTSSDTGSPT